MHNMFSTRVMQMQMQTQAQYSCWHKCASLVNIEQTQFTEEVANFSPQRGDEEPIRQYMTTVVNKHGVCGEKAEDFYTHLASFLVRHSEYNIGIIMGHQFHSPMTFT